MMELISEIMIDPTHTLFYLGSGDNIAHIGIDFEADYPDIRILQIFLHPLEEGGESFLDELEVVDGRFTIWEGNGFGDLALFSSSEKSIYYLLDQFDDDTDIFALHLFAKDSNITLENEDFVFLNSSKQLEIVDTKTSKVVRVMETPPGYMDDDNFNQLVITYGNGFRFPARFYIEGLDDGKYTKPLFCDDLDDISIKYS